MEHESRLRLKPYRTASEHIDGRHVGQLFAECLLVGICLDGGGAPYRAAR